MSSDLETPADPITISRSDLQTLFDLAVGSLDFGSGFWEIDDVEAGHRIADALGVDRMTPDNHMPHAFHLGFRGRCSFCRFIESDQRHQQRAEETP